MALIFCDGFDHYDTAHLFEKWSGGSGTIVSGGREGQGLATGGGNYVSKNLPGNTSTLIVGFAFNQTSIGNVLLRLYDVGSSGFSQCSINCNGDGSLSVWDYNNNPLGTSAAGIMHANTFQYLEVSK